LRVDGDGEDRGTPATMGLIGGLRLMPAKDVTLGGQPFV
jgi:hypothetical protein